MHLVSSPLEAGVAVVLDEPEVAGVAVVVEAGMAGAGVAEKVKAELILCGMLWHSLHMIF